MKIFGIGWNYAEHIAELRRDAPAPILFIKPETAYLKNQSIFYYPDFSNEVHHEVELVIKINKACKNVSEKFAHKYFDEIAVGLDITARDIQRQAMEKGQPWTIAKGFNGSAPISDFIPINNFPALDNINFHLKVNGEVRQQGNSGMMIYNFSKIISYISKYFLLKKGDMILTGTPKGVGEIKIGDKLEAFIEERKMLEILVK